MENGRVSYLICIRLVHGITEIFTLRVTVAAYRHVTARTAAPVHPVGFPGRVLVGCIWTEVPNGHADERMTLVSIYI